MKHKVISVSQHPNNADRLAVLMSGDYKGRDIYKVKGGFVALLGSEQCFEGLFPSQREAEIAQETYFRESVKSELK